MSDREVLTALRMLRSDPNYQYLESQQAQTLVRSALLLGEQCAATLEVDFATVEQLCVQKGIAVITTELALPGYRVRAVYSHNPPQIRLNATEIPLLAAQIAQSGLCGASSQLAQWSRDMILAHELFHHYERTETQWDAKKLWKIKAGIFRRRRYLESFSEIAAHRFAQVLLGLPFYPGELDFEDVTKGDS